MDLKAEIERMKAESFAALRRAVDLGDVRATIERTRILERVTALEFKYAELEKEIAVANDVTADEHAILEPPPERRKNGETRRRRGQTTKEGFALWLASKGIELHQGRGASGARWKTPSGALVGVASATEARPDRWFLGLQDEDYEAIVLLCESSTSRPLRFIFPKDFYARYRHNFSVSNGQLKFNVFRSGGNYHTTIPGCGKVQINDYLDKGEVLKAIQ